MHLLSGIIHFMNLKIYQMNEKGHPLKNKNTVTITVNVLPEVKRKAKEKASSERRTLSNYVMCLIEADLAISKPVPATK